MPQKIARLKRLKRREILRIGTLDILGINNLESTVQNLSDLADSVIQAVLALAKQELEPHYARVSASFAVLGLGKLGGQELNYSSDIDIIFVYSEEGQAKRKSTGRTFSFHEYFNLLTEKLVQLLSKFSEGEALYRVDTRLRPEGTAGPLARSAASMLRYYEMRGRLWERQMLIKARPVAGDLEFGHNFLRQLRSFVYPATFFQSPLEEIAQIKRTIEEKLTQRGQENANIKLSQGGIRDVEFAVQALQLLNGGRQPELREPNTLRAIEKLAERGQLCQKEAGTLREALLFFRKVEHYLQLEDWRQTHLLPEEPHHRLVLARKMGFSDWSAFREVLRDTTVAVRRIYNSILGGKKAISSSHADLPSPTSTSFRQIDFENPARAQRILTRLASGTHEHPATQAEAKAFREFLPKLLAEIAQTPCPDETLQNLENLIRSHGARQTLFGLLGKESGMRRLFFDLAGEGSLLVQLLTAEPHLFGVLLNPAEWQRLFSREEFEKALAARQKAFPGEDLEEKLLHLKHYFQLRIGIQFLESLFPFPTILKELSLLADSVVTQAWTQILREAWPRNTYPAILLALGKWGVSDLNFSSDLDVIFLTGEEKTIPQQETMLRELISLLAKITPLGQLYKIDTRLRAEGKNAPLLISVNAYKNYLVTRAQLWERQALLRLRPIAGNTALWPGFRSFLESYLFDPGLSTRGLKEIEHMLHKIHQKAAAHNRRGLDFKNLPGGVVQIEFLVQAFQLKYGKEWPELRQGNTTELLTQLAEHKLLSAEDARFLKETYLLFRRLEAVLNLGLQRSRARLPLESSKMRFAARVLGFPTENAFLSDLQKRMAAVSRLWLKIFD